MKVLFIHNKKCGGMSILKELEKIYDVERHNKFLKILNKNKFKYIIGNIRNPYEYYVSLYIWGPSSRGKLDIVDSEYEKLSIPLEKEIKEKKENRIKLFRLWMKYLLKNKNSLIGQNKCNLSKIMKDYNIGLMTARFLCYYYKNFDDEIADKYFRKYLSDVNLQSPYTSNFIKLENIKEDLKSVNIKYNNTWVNDNKSQGYLDFPWYKYYDQELIDLIYEKDKHIFNKFDYDKINLDNYS